MTSPYTNQPVSNWPKITEKLLASHPLSQEEILNVAVRSWETLWKTRVGIGDTAINLKELDVPATVVGYFFEILFATEMEDTFPAIGVVVSRENWRSSAFQRSANS